MCPFKEKSKNKQLKTSEYLALNALFHGSFVSMWKTQENSGYLGLRVIILYQLTVPDLHQTNERYRLTVSCDSDNNMFVTNNQVQSMTRNKKNHTDKPVKLNSSKVVWIEIKRGLFNTPKPMLLRVISLVHAILLSLIQKETWSNFSYTFVCLMFVSSL